MIRRSNTGKDSYVGRGSKENKTALVELEEIEN